VSAAQVLRPLVAVVLVALLTQCKSFSGIDPMTADGWEEVHMQDQVPVGSLRDRTGIVVARFFVKYRDAEREGPIATISVRYEGLEMAALPYRSEVMRVQFDCVKRMNRTLADTVYQNNNLKGKSTTRESPYALSQWGTANKRSSFDILITPVCARTAPQGAEGK
jgi:hypothetical protein